MDGEDAAVEEENEDEEKNTDEEWKNTSNIIVNNPYFLGSF